MQPLFVIVRRVSCKRTCFPSFHSKHIRRLATEASGTPKKRGTVRRVLLFSTITTVGLYGVGTLFAIRNEPFHDIFVEYIPYGNQFVKFAEQRGWEGHSVDSETVLRAGRAAIEELERARTNSISAAQKWIERAKESNANSIKGKKTSTASNDSNEGDGPKIEQTPTSELLEKAYPGISPNESESAVEDSSKEMISENVQDVLVSPLAQVESVFTESLPQTAEESLPSLDANVYMAELPLGFEIPPGFISRPRPNSESLPSQPDIDIPVEVVSDVPELPLLAPIVGEFASSEPVLSQLASTIDNLASFSKENPSLSVNSNVKHILETAQNDLTTLGERLQTIKEQEKAKLEQRLEEQARDYSLQLLQLELAAQDRLDQQGEEWRKFSQEERQQLVRAYRAKLEAELQAQGEIINQRLKEEVIAQGIELQRRWIREVRVRVEAERGGRLAKLDELTADIKRLSRITLDNSEYLDENLRLHALWSSIRSLQSIILDSTSRKPFREELRTLRHVILAGGEQENRLSSLALEVLEDSDIPDIGVEPFADLASWFTTNVAPRVCSVSLVPDQNAGFLSYIASSVLSSIRVRRRGLVEGNDVYDVISRAEYYMNEKDLDSAARELNQLTGPAKMLLHDWLEASRKRLEVLQALEVVATHATLASLLLIK